MKKKRLKLDFFAIFHPFFLLLIGLIFYFVGFILFYPWYRHKHSQ